MSTLLDDYVTREQLAEELKVTTRTLDKWAWLRRGPAKIKVGSRCYYHRKDVLSWLDAQRQALAKECA
ncbi:helix-turn-helix domain-containing protein [Luteibacter sp.]|uniref:helix-turn-helix transcriptional regulator n=1 Tax=Luteibacter sp. TaxID=1886636 RepID=UPI002809D55C|nr:helix-turn-helix domain-containing protein [Luteibacter sp.]MDQ8051061.1 helix-turn-helix domain-containing protein [Luteibacter sp.]